MPTPTTKGALPVSAANFEAPYSTPTIAPGQEGLNLRKALSALQPNECARMSNVTWTEDDALTGRLGQTLLATSGGTKIHSIGSLRDPLSGTATRIWGIDTNLFVGLTATLTNVDSGFSGDPLSIVPYRPPLSGQPWAYVADRLRMRKVRSDGLDLPIGLPSPAAQPTVALATENRTDIALFLSSDTSEAAQWTAHVGTGGGALPTASDETDHVSFVTFQADTADTYFQFLSLPRILDLARVGTTLGTPTDAEDEDHIHLFVKISHPEFIVEARVYFVVSDDFSESTESLPGTEPGKNTNAYVKSIRPGDLAQFFTGDKTAVEQTADAAAVGADEDFIEDREPEITGEGGVTEFRDENGALVPYKPTGPSSRAQTRQGNTIFSTSGGSGAHEWIELGVAGAGLQRSEFTRIGSDSGRDWSTVTGIIIYISCVGGVGVGLALREMWLTGGCGPDNTQAGAAGYDYRFTDFDPRTGAESNPCPILADADPYGIFPVRRCVTLTPAANGDSAIRQRFYRRGGTLGNNWYRLTNVDENNDTNSSDGGAFTDDNSDAAIVNSDTVEIDHAQPVQTVDADGTIIRAQPVAAMWGPINDILFACGDPNRAGHLYWSIPGEPDHWSPFNTFEVCGPSEELMNGGYYGGQGFVFSRKRLYWVYPNLDGTGSISVTPTSCAKGLFSRWGLAVGSAGIFFVNREGVWRTTGGNPQVLTPMIGNESDGGIFRDDDDANTVNGFRAIDWDFPEDIKLEIWGTDLWFQYRDKGGTNRTLILDTLRNRWKWYDWGQESGTFFLDLTLDTDTDRMLIGGRASGNAYTYEGTSDDGTAITSSFRTGAWDAGMGRSDKLFGDLFMDANTDLTDIVVATFLNDEEVTNLSSTIGASNSGRERYIIDAFGTTPQRGRSVSVNVSWTSGSRYPKIYTVGVSVIAEPESVNLRATQWDAIGSANEKYVTGVMIECDTYNVQRPVIVEFMQGTTITTAKSFNITHNGRRRHFETWTGVKADRIRVRPDTDCVPWILYQLDWISEVDPPRIAGVDSYDENHYDTYCTGLDLVINTFNVAKTFNLRIDGTLVTNPITSTTDFSVTANGRQVVHLSFTPIRGHIYRFNATDDNDALLYDHRWHLEAEPSEQANWNQNFDILGTQTDKYIKGVKLECDTFNVAKTVTIEVDGSTAATLTVTANGRRVLHFAFAQVRGRVVRILPTDTNPGRLYSKSLIFDEEPLGLQRWETQELTLGTPGWKFLLEGWITYRSSASATLTVTALRENNTTTVKTYTLPSSSGNKRPHYLTFEALKGVLFKFLITSTSDIWIYRPETRLKVGDWSTGAIHDEHPFGDDDLDLVRGLHNAEQAASVGGTSRA